MSKMKIAAALLGGLLSSVCGGGAQAVQITYADFGGGSSFSSKGFDITATGGDFQQKGNFGGSFGVGVGSVNNSVVSGEIDAGKSVAEGGTGVPESISFQTSIPQFLESFTVAFLYPKGQFSDDVNETARIIINNITYTLSVDDGGGTATFSDPGLVNVFLDNANGGQWTVSFLNPFLLQGIVFAPGNGGPNSVLGDFAFNQLTTSPVPGPIVGAGLPGLMMALGGLVVLARRRRHHAGV
ncbi:hypothetical protein [Bradyrhizobium sp. McL0615]|uniref:hypothetical protein n=1 Tax=Bradyrhizobium sp. McL0615 TaxID=3415673 RepID=UPI003CF1A594